MELPGPTLFALYAVSSSTATTATTTTTISAVSSASTRGHAYELDRLASELPLLLSTGMDSS